VVFDFKGWSRWLETTAQGLKGENVSAEIRGSASACCFRIGTPTVLGQFAVWMTGEADFDVMDAQSGEFVDHSWGMRLDDSTFEAAFKTFLMRSLGKEW
jgi:hypothetical protein